MRKVASRDDIVPLILGGDMSSYPLAREFYEAFGVVSTCVTPAPIEIVSRSRFTRIHEVEDMSESSLKAAISEVARANPTKSIVIITNYDAAVDRVATIADDLPSNVVYSLPRYETLTRVSNKVSFAEICAEHGLDAPKSQLVHVGDGSPKDPAAFDFPVIAKPAVSSAAYVSLYEQGFKKVYFIQEQRELDELWEALENVGFEGDFLVQQLIPGDDTYVDMMTAYVDQSGEVTMLVSSQVLLEDHTPTLFGNPVAMITRPMPKLWEKVAAMLKAIGWRGFANFDMKRDPATGAEIFMDFNPRIGNNSYYACVGGVNPMEAFVADLVDGSSAELRTDRIGLYTRARTGLIRKYLTDPALRAEFDRIVHTGPVGNPMLCAADTLPARMLGHAMEINYDRKFAKYYPEPTNTSF